MGDTSDARGAQRHARAMAGQRVEAMATLPPSDAPDIPDGVAAADMLWAETLAPFGYAARRLPRGARLRLIDLQGDASVAMLLFNAEQPSERLNVADTMKIQWNAYLGETSLLLSDLGRVMASLLTDDSDGHDLICGASNSASRRRIGDAQGADERLTGRDRLSLGAARFGLAARDVHPCVNWFKPVRVGREGDVVLDAGPFRPGRGITLRADMEVIVVIANCRHVLDPRTGEGPTPVRVLAWRGEAAAADDPARGAGLEAGRAFMNTDDYYRR